MSAPEQPSVDRARADDCRVIDRKTGVLLCVAHSPTIARCIARALNCHDELVEALELTAHEVEHRSSTVRAALSKATEGTAPYLDDELPGGCLSGLNERQAQAEAAGVPGPIKSCALPKKGPKSPGAGKGGAS